jgi:hypothetical protein
MASKTAFKINSVSRVRALQDMTKLFWLEYMVNIVAYRQTGQHRNPRNPAMAKLAEDHPDRYRELYLSHKAAMQDHLSRQAALDRAA